MRRLWAYLTLLWILPKKKLKTSGPTPPETYSGSSNWLEVLHFFIEFFREKWKANIFCIFTYLYQLRVWVVERVPGCHREPPLRIWRKPLSASNRRKGSSLETHIQNRPVHNYPWSKIKGLIQMIIKRLHFDSKFQWESQQKRQELFGE